MIDRFNFYDIYGFVLPGTLLAGIFWLPFGLATNSLPSSEISSTLLLLVLAYIAGHLLQTVAQVVVPSKVRDPQKKLRERSSLILDTSNHVFGPDFKKHLGEQINAAFDVQIIGDDDKTIANRTSTFFQARTYLLQNKSTGYVEQFEGLYVMMRGFACAFFIGCAYLLGWGLVSLACTGNGFGRLAGAGGFDCRSAGCNRVYDLFRGAGSSRRQGAAGAAGCEEENKLHAGFGLFALLCCRARILSRNLEDGNGEAISSPDRVLPVGGAADCVDCRLPLPARLWRLRRKLCRNGVERLFRVV